MFEYILREIFLSVIAFLAGAGVSAGVFAFVLRDRSGAAHTSVLAG